MKYIKGLDTLRALAVTMVLIWHFTPRQDFKTLTGIAEQFLLPTGVFGVTLFFVLSGYLISTILLTAKQENGNENKITVIKNFIIRRSLRIFPIYYLLLVILIAVSYKFSQGELPYLFTYTSNIFVFKYSYWGNFGHAWSLAVEEQFYLVWPWLIIFLNAKYLKYVFPFFIFTGIASSFIVSHLYIVGFNSPLSVLTTSCLDTFGIGGMYAYFVINKTDKRMLNNALRYIFIGALLISVYWKLCPYFNIYGHWFWLSRTINSLIAISIIHFTINNKAILLKRYLFENTF